MSLLWLPRLIGTAQAYFRIGLTGPRLKNNAGALAVRNAGDSANAAMAAASLTLDTPLAESQGGTGKNSYAVGDILYASGSSALSKLAGNTTTTKKFLSQTGTGSASAAPAWGTLAAADIPNLDWSKITTGKPTTLAGYGITNAAATDSIPTFSGGVGGAQGGQIHLARPAPSDTALTSDVVIDASANNVRFFGYMGVGQVHGAYINLAGCTGFNLLWHDGNDGAGSGLDADLLDGQHGSAYAPIGGPHFVGPISVGGPSPVTPSGALASAYGSIALGDSDTGFRAVTDGVLEFWCNNAATAASWADHWEFPVSATIGGWGNPAGIAALYVPGYAVRTVPPYYWLAISGIGYMGSNVPNIAVSIQANGRILAQEFNAFSDIRLKENIQPIDARRGLDFIQKVEPVTFNWKNPDDPGTNIGYIAQQVIKAGFPELVACTENKDLPELIDDDGLVSPAGVQMVLCYEQAIPLHTAALKGLLARIEGLERRIAVLEAERDDGK